MNDLYEVCGQAEKSIRWTKNVTNMLNQLLKRDVLRNRKNPKSSRFEVGDKLIIKRIINKLRFYPTKFKIFIVQPGVDSTKITPEMDRILCCSEGYLSDTSDIPLTLICS